MQKALLLTTLIAGSALLTGGAYAGPLSVQVTAGSDTQTFGPSSTGVIIFNTTATGYSMINGTATGAPQGNNPSLIDLNSLQLASSTGGTVQIAITETGLTSLGGGGFIGAIGGTLGENVKLNYSAYIDTTNTAFGKGTSLGTAPFTQTDGTFSFSGQFGSSPSVGTGLFSETEIITLTASGTTTTSFDARVNQTLPATVPEPVSLMLLGTGLVGVGLTRSRKKG